MLNWFYLCVCIHACLCMCFLRSSHSLWGESVHQVLSEGSGRNWKADGPWANGSSAYIIRLVYGHGLDLLSTGGDHWSSPTAGCQAGAFNPVWRVCCSHIKTRHILEPYISISGKVVSICQGKVSSLSYIVSKNADEHYWSKVWTHFINFRYDCFTHFRIIVKSPKP